jgi:hypothetical protein
MDAGFDGVYIKIIAPRIHERANERVDFPLCISAAACSRLIHLFVRNEGREPFQ